MTDSTPETKPLRKLTARERVFVKAYLETWNKTKAAEAAKYKDPQSQAWQVYNRPAVQAELEKAIKEAGMGRDAIAARISQQAEINPSDFFFFKTVPVVDEKGKAVINSVTNEPELRKVMTGINWDMVESHGYLIKKITYNAHDIPILEFVDNQKALETMARINRMLIDRVENQNINVEVSADDIALARDAAKKFDEDFLNGSK